MSGEFAKFSSLHELLSGILNVKDPNNYDFFKAILDKVHDTGWLTEVEWPELLLRIVKINDDRTRDLFIFVFEKVQNSGCNV